MLIGESDFAGGEGLHENNVRLGELVHEVRDGLDVVVEGRNVLPKSSIRTTVAQELASPGLDLDGNSGLEDVSQTVGNSRKLCRLLSQAHGGGRLRDRSPTSMTLGVHILSVQVRVKMAHNLTGRRVVA